MSANPKKLTPKFVNFVSMLIATVPVVLGSSCFAQVSNSHFSGGQSAIRRSASSQSATNSQASEIERLLQIHPDGRPVSQPLQDSTSTYGISQGSTEFESSAALSSLLSAPLPSSVEPRPSYVKPAGQAISQQGEWIQPEQTIWRNRPVQANSGGAQVSDPMHTNPLRETAIGNGPVAPVSYSQPTEPSYEVPASGVATPVRKMPIANREPAGRLSQAQLQLASQLSATADESLPPTQTLVQNNGINSSSMKANSMKGFSSDESAVPAWRMPTETTNPRMPRPLDSASRSAATALPSSTSNNNRQPFQRSLNQAISSPNLIDDLNPPVAENFSKAAVISEAELADLKSKVHTASAGTFSLTDSGSVELALGSSSEIDLIGPQGNSMQEPKAESESLELTEPQDKPNANQSMAEIDSLIDDLKENVKSSKATDGEVPTFQPYASGPIADSKSQRDASTSRTETTPAVKMASEQLLNFSADWMRLQPFDFAGFRQYLRQSHLESGPTAALQIAESQYQINRGQYDKAAEALSTIDSNKLSVGDRWLWSWQQAQLAIETNQSRLLQASMEDLVSLPNNVHSLPFLTYCEAHLFRLQQPVNYSESVKTLEQCLMEIKEAEAQPNPQLSSLLKRLNLRVHNDMGEQILSGPFKYSEGASGRWFEAAKLTLEDSSLPQESLRIGKIHCLFEKLRAKSRSGKASDLAVDYAFLQTQIAQQKTEVPAEDAQWFDQQWASLNYDCALACFNQQDYAASEKYLEPAFLYYQQQSKSNPNPWEQYCNARCFWLIGALADAQKKPLGATQAFEKFVEQIPNHLTTRINADQANQGERLGSVAVALWKQGDKQQAVQMAQASVAQMYSAIEQGFATEQRVVRLEQNLALMQDQMSNPATAPNQQRATAVANSSRNMQGPVAAAIMQRSTASSVPENPGVNHKQPGANSVNTNPSTNTNPNSTPVKTFWKNLFSSSSKENAPAGNGQTQNPAARTAVHQPTANRQQTPRVSMPIPRNASAPKSQVPVIRNN